MYNWNVDIWLKSGVKLECNYPCNENNTLDVSNKIFSGKQFTDIVGLNRREDRGNTYVVVGEIAAFDIYA